MGTLALSLGACDSGKAGVERIFAQDAAQALRLPNHVPKSSIKAVRLSE